MKVAYVELDGKKHPMAFSNSALLRFEEETGVNALSNSRGLKYSEMLKLIFVALLGGARKMKQDYPYTMEETWDLLDEVDDFMNILDELREIPKEVPQKKTGNKTTAPKKKRKKKV